MSNDSDKRNEALEYHSKQPKGKIETSVTKPAETQDELSLAYSPWVAERCKEIDKDVLHWKDYDYVVVNEDLNNCYKEIIGYLENTVDYNKSKIEKHINKLI